MALELITQPIGKLKETIRTHREMGIPLVIMGPPGVGKTQICKQVAVEDDAHYTEMLLAGRDIGDVMMPFVTGDKLIFHYNDALPIKGSRWDDGRPVYFNIDEFSGAKPLMQNLLLKVLDERRIGEAYLSDNVSIVATGNRAWDLAHVEQLSAALGNRATFVTVEPDLGAFMQYALANNFHPIVLAWIKFDPTYLLSFDGEQFLAGDPAFCSPRSNERLSKILYRYEKGMSDEVFTSCVCGTIGAKTGIKFTGFIKFRSEMPDIEAALAGKPGVKVPKAPEVIYATIFSIVQRVEKANLQNAINYIDQFSNEWKVMFSTSLAPVKPNLITTSIWGNFASQIANL